MPFNLSTIFSSGTEGFLKGVDDILSRFISSPEDRSKAMQALTDANNKHIEVMAAQAQAQVDSELKDVQSARDLYKQNSALQKGFAITFLIGYIILVGTLVAVFTSKIDLSAAASTFVGTIFGAMTTNIQTIVNFLFGSSQSSKDKDNTINALSKQQ